MKVFVQHMRSDGSVERTPVSGFAHVMPRKGDVFVFEGDAERFAYKVQGVIWEAGIAEGTDVVQSAVIVVGKALHRSEL